MASQGIIMIETKRRYSNESDQVKYVQYGVRNTGSLEEQVEAVNHAPDQNAVKLFWYLFAGTNGGPTRLHIITYLRERPYNTLALARILRMDYKSIQHHLRVLEKNNLVIRMGERYNVMFFISPYLEAKIDAFEEVSARIRKT